MPPSFIPLPLLLLLLLLIFRADRTSSRPLPNDRHAANIPDLKRYFQKFGYLDNSSSATDESDGEFESAVSVYQSRHGLAVTGQLDSATLALISSPRCGVTDKITTSSGGSSGSSSISNSTVSRYAYFPGQPRWNRPSPITLTYAISPTDTISYISRPDMEAAVRRAFDRWAAIIPVKFVPAIDYYAADVKLGFYAGDHGDGEPFDGVLGVLAHAFSPQSGRLHLDAAERWAVDFGLEESKVAVDLESVATHEIGHVLGLGHSAVKEAVMFPSLSPRTKKVELTVDDVEGVQALYGSNPNFNISSVLESDTSGAAAAADSITRFAGTILLGFLIVLWI